MNIKRTSVGIIRPRALPQSPYDRLAVPHLTQSINAAFKEVAAAEKEATEAREHVAGWLNVHTDLKWAGFDLARALRLLEDA